MKKNNKGVALIISLLVMVVLMILGGVLILRSVTEKRSSDEDRRSIQAFYIAEAGGNEAMNHLDVLVNTDLLNTVNQTNPQTLGNRAQQYVTAHDGLGFLVTYTKVGGVAQFNCCDTLACAQTSPCNYAVYNGTTTSLGSGNYLYSIIVTEKSDPITVGTDKWDFPYNFTVSSLGTVGSASKRKIILTGDFTVRVQRDNFARYALFTDHHGTPSGGTVWFTNFTNFSGPLHTNERYSFAFNPSGTFSGLVTQHNTNARFYNNGSPFLADADSNAPKDVPVFNAGYQRGVNEINLESSVTQQDLMDQARGGDRSSISNGIYVPNSGGNLTGGIFVKGDGSVNMGIDANGNAKYTVTQGGVTKYITVDRSAHQTKVETEGGGTTTYNGLPDGVDNLGTIIYVDGKVNSLKGTVQKDTEVTVSSQSDIMITDNVKYQEYNAGPPANADDKTNLLGIVSWGGDVRIASSAPNDINIHGTIMARNGILTVDDYDSGLPRGTANLLGGVISDFYGAFGQFNSETGTLVHGYARNFVYDSRMAAGKSPPYFPSMRTFIAFTDDITDKVYWQEGGI